MGENGVLTVPNTFYFSLKYSSQYLGNKIYHILSKKPRMTIYENAAREFTCRYNKMKIIITENSEINELCEIIINNQKNQDTTKFVNFFCRHFATQNQEEILDVFFTPYYFNGRIKKDAIRYVIDGVFAVIWQEITVLTHHLEFRRKERHEFFSWEAVKLEVKEKIEEYKIIKAFDGRDLIMDEDTQILVSKIFFLLSLEKKRDYSFMVQLSSKVKRWIEKGDVTAKINWNNTILQNKEEEEEEPVPAGFSYYPTPPEVVELMLEYANIEKGMTILEPSAGQGHILEFLKDYDVTCGELYYKNREILEEKGYKLAFENFLEYVEARNLYDRIIMNPPFRGLNNERHADIDHVVHAVGFLKPGGKLISVMFATVTFSPSKKAKEFREFVDANGYFVELPKESFKKSGTLMPTVIVVIDKQEEEK